jgi:hypothetical protein
MQSTPTSRRELPWVGSLSAVVISLMLIFLGLIGIGNEVRYQGCLARGDTQTLIAVTKDARSSPPVPLGCERSPF